MKTSKLIFLFVLIVAVTIPLGMVAAKGKPTGGETAGNNLSYPVIWAEGFAKTLPGTPGMTPALGGEWWYWWGTEGVDPNITPLSCAPDPDDMLKCNDGIPGQAASNLPPADDPDLVKAYLQKDPLNIWQASTIDAKSAPVNVDYIDWGDNLESVDWYTRSQVRTEVVLFEDLAPYWESVPSNPFVEYGMRHTSGWGIDEVHGMAASLAGEPEVLPGTRATVYSNCARLTIQKLLVKRDDPAVVDLVWDTGAEGGPQWVGQGLINEPIFNLPVYAGGDGPGYYSAEINVKGRIIYGYTWNVRTLDKDDPDKASDYRLTFSFDQSCGSVDLNTFFDASTQIMVPLEEEVTTNASAEEPGGGGTAVFVPVQFDENGEVIAGTNLTYMDIRILERSGGGGGKGGGLRSRLIVKPIRVAR